MEFKNEINGFKFNVEKGADEVTFGVKKEQNNINIYYVDNSQININIPVIGQAGVNSEVFDQRIKYVVEERTRRMAEEIKQLQREAFAKYFVATTGVSIASSSSYMTTGNASDIKVVDDPK